MHYFYMLVEFAFNDVFLKLFYSSQILINLINSDQNSPNSKELVTVFFIDFHFRACFARELTGELSWYILNNVHKHANLIFVNRYENYFVLRPILLPSYV